MFRKTNSTPRRTRLGRPTPAMAVACTALFMALGGVGYAAATIGSAQIKNNSVQGKDIKNSTITSKDISKGTRKALKGQTGPQGAPGVGGPKGDNGANGANGPRGIVTPQVATPASVPIPADFNEVDIVSKVVPPGTYVVTVKTTLVKGGVGGKIDCGLAIGNGGSLDTAQFASPGNGDRTTVTMVAVATVTNNLPLKASCLTDNANVSSTAVATKLIAIPVG